ncbi:hypothetical protein GBA65_11645 [Rubrobacter marinus]|uniref:Uncharacterized protein n=1 Tax=Rubrobacter marinus TaxID=2653852 RepID=A0A6G8PXZ2_9ACTN|nr:hypothetical protein [Rubrobacter marinus]QIN79066.1 hypothetical protein GBA65_11645 [Rubrobacter marinus]
MGILRWAFAGLVALLVGLGFAVLTGSVLLAAVPAAGALLIAAYLSWEGRPLHQATREIGRRSPRRRRATPRPSAVPPKATRTPEATAAELPAETGAAGADAASRLGRGGVVPRPGPRGDPTQPSVGPGRSLE